MKSPMTKYLLLYDTLLRQLLPTTSINQLISPGTSTMRYKFYREHKYVSAACNDFERLVLLDQAQLAYEDLEKEPKTRGLPRTSPKNWMELC